MQPDDRQSADAMPLAVYALPDGAWNPLLKAGPSGLISLLTLSVWWGQALLARTQWQDDSSDQWVAFKADLRLSLHAMLESISMRGKRKASDSDSSTKSSKRSVFTYIMLLNDADPLSSACI